MVSRTIQGKAYLYSFNFKHWTELKDFVIALQEYQVLHLVPREALLIKSYGDSVIFKSVRAQDATLTSFSVYEDYGILVDLRDYFYTLPKRAVHPGDIHTLPGLGMGAITKDFLRAILSQKPRQTGGYRPPHDSGHKWSAVGERIRGYPILEDINERAELYEIEL